MTRDLKGFYILITVLGLACFLMYVGRGMEAAPVIKLVPQRELMSITEQHQFLKDTGKKRYDPGRVCNIPGPKFRKALENYICDRNYKESTYE